MQSEIPNLSLNSFTLHNDFSYNHKYNYTVVKYKIINNAIRLIVPFTKAKKTLQLIIDTGAQMSILKLDALLPSAPIYMDEKRQIRGISQGPSTHTLGRVTGNLIFNDIPFLHNFQIMMNSDITIPADGLLGNEFLINYEAVLNLRDETMRIHFPKYYLREESNTVCKITEQDFNPENTTLDNKKLHTNQQEEISPQEATTQDDQMIKMETRQKSSLHN